MPGAREFDAPRRGVRGPLAWVLGVVGAVLVLVAAAGLFAGVGPLRAIGAREESLTPLAWRPTGDPAVIQVAVLVPPSGICSGDDVVPEVIERGARIEVGAVLRSPRGRGCTPVGIAGDRVWIDVPVPPGEGGGSSTAIVSAVTKEALPQEALP